MFAADATPVTATLGPAGVRFTAPSQPGRYVINAFLIVPQGDVSYGLLLEVR
jgi:hypothetical protein